MNLDTISRNLQKTLPNGGLKATTLPGCPEIKLYLFDPEQLPGPLAHEVAQAVVAEPAYWSFCWASGQAMASYILSHPELVTGKRVLDFGSGSGVVAIASLLAGAQEVVALDIDALALDACRANAELNGVLLHTADDFDAVTNRQSSAPLFDVITAADVLYDRDNMPLLDTLLEHTALMLLADSRIKHLNHAAYRIEEVYSCRTWPDLNEFEEFNRVRIYHGTRLE